MNTNQNNEKVKAGNKMRFVNVVSSNYTNSFAIQPVIIVGLLLVMKVLQKGMTSSHNAFFVFLLLFILFILGFFLALLVIKYFIYSFTHFFDQLKSNAFLVVLFSALNTTWILTHRQEISAVIFENSLIFLIICLFVYLGFPITMCIRVYIQKKTANESWKTPLMLFAIIFGFVWYYMIFLDFWSVLKLFPV